MLARRFIRAIGAKNPASKQLVTRLVAAFAEPTAYASVAAFATTRKVSNEEAPVISRSKDDLPTASGVLVDSIATRLDSEAALTVLKVNENTSPTDAVTYSHTSSDRPLALNNTISAMLPNTLQKFLLHDKVVAVTG
jgi:hypothetical protein